MTCPFEPTFGHCWCGRKLTGRQKRYCSPAHRREVVHNHRWTQAKAIAKARVTYFKCERCGSLNEKVEVNHKKPCKGKHGTWGCWHHQENLSVLCRPCHLVVTKEQREQGMFE